MCGIAGIVLSDGATPEPRVLRAMIDRIAHRGPDGEGVFTTEGCGFGHRRLSILDLSPAGAQPMLTPDGQHVITFNGEIYDHLLLRDELASLGESFCSRSDTETLLLALRRFGPKVLLRTHGMFAFGHWNAPARTLTLARDRYGKKPLYYSPLGGSSGREGLVFASELRALLAHPRVFAERVIDPIAVAQYLVHEFVPAPRSIFSNVRKLLPGELLTWNAQHGISTQTWYRPVFNSHIRGDPRELAGELLRRVERSVARRLVADVPVGVFLSGGLDSTLITACAVKSQSRVKTFAIGFEDPSFDESAHASTVARHFDTVHTTEVLSVKSLLDLLPSTLDWIDEPHADSSILPMTLLATLARRDVTVALGGDGGDEIMAGYPTFIADRYAQRIPELPGLKRSIGWALGMAARLAPASDANFSLGFKLRQSAQGMASHGAERHARWLAAVDPSDIPRMAGPRLFGASAQALDAAKFSARGCARDFDAATAFYLGVYLGEGVLQKVDRATMRVSLEARAPLLDPEVVEFCLALDPGLRLRGQSTKWLMRKCLENLAPRHIVARPKKGFGAPVGQWLRGPLRGLMQDTLSHETLAEGGWFDPTAVRRMISEHLSGRADLRKPLFALMVFERWRANWG